MNYINSTKVSIYHLFKLINITCIIVYIIWYITPVFRAYLYGTFFNAIIIGLIVIWFLTSIVLKPEWLLQWNFHLIIVTIQIIIFIVMALIGYGGNALSYLKIGISFWFILYVYHFYIYMGWKKTVRKIGVLILIIIFITSVTTLVGLISTPNASRLLTSSSTALQESKLLESKNIGGFDFVYGLIMLVPTLFGIIFYKNKREKNKPIKFIFLILITLIFLIILQASFTIALFSLFIAVILGLVSKMKSININLVIVLSFMLFLILPKNIIGEYITQIAVNVDNTYVNERLLEVGNYLQGLQSTSRHLSHRTLLYDMSFNTFLDNPLTGVGPYYYVPGVGLGYHSQILDDLARYGMFGLVFYILFFYSFHKYVSNQWRKSGFNVNFLVSILLLLFVSFLNPTFSSQTISIVIFFLLPGLPYILNFKRYISNEAKS